MPRSFEIPSANHLSLTRAVSVSQAFDSGRRRQILSLFDVGDRGAVPTAEEIACRAR